MTRRGFELLQEELKQLKSVERPRNVQEIADVRAHGDTSENAEFHAAKERQSHLEARIRMVEDRLARAQVIEATAQDSGRVVFGATVLLTDVETAEEVRYTIVGEDESDVAQGMISVTSPVARALLGKTVDEVVRVRVPKGTRQFEILEICFDRA